MVVVVVVVEREEGVVLSGEVDVAVAAIFVVVHVFR